MRSIRNSSKRAVNLTINAKVLDMAREMGINISQTVDALLTEEVLRQHWLRWNEDNKGAIADYNARIEREGLFSDRYRSFMRADTTADAEPDAA
jgi:antitoxin CcdA